MFDKNAMLNSNVLSHRSYGNNSNVSLQSVEKLVRLIVSLVGIVVVLMLSTVEKPQRIYKKL